MERNREFKELHKIKKVAAPPFLFTRIEQKIQNLKEEKAPLRWVYALSFSFSVLLCFNIFLISSSLSKDNTSSELQVLIEDMNMDTSNQLYHE